MVNFTADKLKQSREAGYSDDEIWGFLSEQDERFNKTKEAGYSLDEVSGFLSEQQPQQEPKPAQPEQPQPPVGTSFMEEIAAIPQAIRQAVDQPLEAMGETAEVLGAPSVGGALRGAVDAAEGYVPAAQRFMEPQEGEFQIGGFAPQFLPRAIVEQAGQIAGAIATRAAGMAVGGLAGSALGPKGTVAGSVAGAFLGPALFEMSQIVGPVARERAANQGREEPTTDDLAWAWGTAGASGALNAIGAKYLPNGDKLVGGLANKIATAVAGEGATEGLQSVVQQTGQTFLTEQGLEIKPKEALGEAIMGGGAGGAAVVAAAPFTPTPEAKAAAAADTKIAAEQSAPVAPETAQVVSEQANQVITEAQAEETAETPDERVARLQREAQEGAGDIELEEEPPVSGLPPVEPTPPVTPTPEAAVAPVEPVVPVEGAVEPAVTEVAPEVRDAEYVASVERGDNETAQRLVDSAFRAVTKPETTDAVFERHKDFKMMGLTLEEIAQNPEALAEKDKDDYDTVMYWVSQIEQGNTPTVVADEKGSLWDGFHRLVASKIAGSETLNVFTSEKETSTDQLSQTVRRDAEGNVIPLSERFPAPVTPTPVTPTPVTPEVPTAVEPPALAPLRRIVKAEQTEEDVSGLVGQGLVELYNGQPVITQAGLETLPEAERPRLTPEARKIQIDTRTSEAAAEAISKNLRIGVDQVPVDVKMPAGWTIEGDIYIPPVVEAAPEFAFAQEVEAKKQNIKTNMIRFASGMSGISDLRAGAYTRAGFKNYGVGFDVGLLSKNAIEELADFIINMDTQAFIDSGAFSNFRKSLKAQEGGKTVEALNFDKIFEKYDAILDAIQRINVAERTDYPRPMIVMPDIIGDQNASLDLIDQYKNRVSLEVSSNTSIPIIPIPLGELSLSEAYNRIIEILKTNTIGSEINPENFVVGIPSNAKAVSKEDLAKFLRESKPPRIHFLGAAADRNISPLIDIVSQNSPETQVTADASKVRSAILSGVAKGKTRKQAIFDALYQEDDPEVVLNAATAPQPEARESRRATTPQQDKDYLDAVERGDLDAASRMVDEAAKAAGYTFGPVWHGTRKEFTRFFNQPTYFSESEQFAKYTVAGKQGRVIKAYLRGNLFDPRNPEHRAQVGEMERMYGKLPETPTYQYFNAAVQNWLQENGWDGHYEQESTTSRYRSLVVFDPMANAKSAEPVTRDDAGNIIPPSQRFQQGEADIRYARTERDPEVQKAAQDLKAGTIDRDEYQRIVDMRMPLRKFEAVPTPATNDDMLRGLGERTIKRKDAAGNDVVIKKTDIIQSPESIAEGTVLEARLDIPAYESENVWVVSLHRPRPDLQKGAAAQVVAYTPTSVLRNVTFGVTEKAAAGIAAGKPKSTIATMRGEYVPMTAEQAYELATTNKDQWVEIGMNPVRHSYFYDKDTQTPVESAEEVVQVGGMVLAKNPVFGKKEDYLYSLREAQPTVGMTTDAVRARLEALGFGVEGMIRIVEDPQAAFEGRTIIQDGKAVRIELNASALNDDAAIDRVLNHEFAEAANADGALNKLVERLTPKEKKEINDAITRLGYEERVRTTEEAARAIEALAAGWKGRGFFERAVARVEAWGSKLGLKLTRRAAEYIAARNLAEVSETVRKWHISDALANLNGARRVTFNGLSAVLIPPSEMQVAYSIVAYHGTPHEIKGGFQTAKIGTGEGATAYGWGLYFAENVEVAKEYQRNLSKGQYALSYEGVPVNELPTDQKNAILKIAAGIPVETVIADLETSLRRQEASKPEDWAVPANRERVIEELKSSIEEARKIKPSEIKPRTAGNLYRVELDVTNDQLLDWDKPFSEQSEKVKEAFLLDAKKRIPIVEKTYRERGLNDAEIKKIVEATLNDAIWKEITGGEWYLSLGKESAKETSELLLSWGILGIRYLDQGSRDSGKGTYNYVIFDESKIKITEKNGQPVDIRESRREPAPTFTEESPEAKTLSNLKASMEKVDSASEAKGGKPETQKVSEIAANWMESGGDERALQDAITENTNLSPANAAKVAKVIAKQYGLQQQIAETGAVIAEIAPEAEGAPRKSAVTKLIEQTTGVRKPVVKIQVSESAALKKQIQLKAREARETRKARKEAAEDLAKSITDYVKANPIRGPINSRQAMSITKKALKLDVNNEAAVDRFEMYVERVIENANYDRDLADARALIKRAKTFAKSKDTQGNVKTTLDAIANISPTLLDNPFEFNLVVQRYLLGLAPVTAKQYAVMPDADVRRYLESLETQISANQDVLNRSKAQRILDKQAAYAEEKGIPLEEAIAILNSEEFLNEKTIEKLEDLTKLLTSMAQESQKDVKSYDDAGATQKQKELISFMRKVSLDSLTNEEKKRYIRFSNNLLANGATFGMEQFQSIALGQEAAIKAVKDKRLSNKLAAWISPIGGDKAIDTARRIALRTQSEADTFKNIFGREAVGAFRNILGLNRLDVAQTDSNRAKEKIANEFGEYFKGLRKKYGDDATGFEAKGYAGIAGYLIQTDGIKTEAESIPYRRRLMEQNIAELRKSDRQTDLAEADLKERALAQLTGTTNAEILSQLRALNPASYEQLMWVKDVMLPKWRDFLKEHDENFRNQANNYNNPDHLTITYKFPEGQLLPNEIEDVYQQDAIGMRIKQAANSIKRKEHANLPVSPRTGTVANIDINFGYNQYNALVDQVDKAFVAPAWEQVVSFTKAPEFEQIMGGRANSLFVKKLLTDIQTSRTRQSMTDDEAQMVAGGVRLARKISTQAVLGGITQPLRQIPDQLTKLFFTTGRVDLITKNLLATAQAAPLLNKFPIGRRGDAQAGTQYASQFSELARKVEASVTDRKWAQYRELMNRVGEFWMAPLRGSDVWAAKVSWMSYYEAELNKKGIKMESWEREAELVDTDQDRKEAASYAEFAVDFYGGASDPTKMASLSKQTNNGWKEFAKLVFLPLNSFALQQKNSLISDLRDAYLRTGDRKASIAAIAGTLAGMAAFHGMRIYIIGGLVYPAGKALLMGIFGIDMEEPDEEEKQKKLEDDWRKFKASMYGNIIAGGAGEFAEKAAIDAVNKATYLIQANVNPDEILDDKGEVMSFRQYEKDVSPLYRFRSFGSSEYSFGLADVLTEQAQRSLTETQQIMTSEEMERYTGNEQAYAMFSTMVEWLYFFRLMDTDVTRIARDLKRQMDKGVEEREKEIKAIRSGR